MTGTGKSYTVKDWFANKVANEVKMNISACDLFAILKESEKAVYAMLDLGHGKKKTMWIPKSVLVEREVSEEAFATACYETMKADSYDEAAEAFAAHWSSFC